MSKTTVFALTVVLTATTPTPSLPSGNVLYVAKNGSDSHSCSQARNPSTAKLTIRAALACIGTAPGAGAGWTVEVAAGTYAENILETQMPRGESWSRPFVLRAKPGNVVTIKAAADHNLRLSPPSVQSFYVVVQGFVFDGSLGTNTQITLNRSRYVRLIGNTVVNTAWENGIIVDINSSNIEILGNKVYAGTFKTRSNSQGVNHAIYFSGDNSIIEGNQVYSVAGWGIHIYSGYYDSKGTRITADNNIIRRNTVFDFGKSARSDGILVGSATNSEVYENTVYNAAPSFCSTGIMVGYGGANNKVMKNKVYGNCTGIVTRNTTNPIIKDNEVFQNRTNLSLN